MRYQYQLLHLENNRVWLAPAWRGQLKLETKRSFFNDHFQGELNVLLMGVINELSAEAWEFLEIRTVSEPSSATQKTEKDPHPTDPNNPVYRTTTSISTSSQTRYLFRKALAN